MAEDPTTGTPGASADLRRLSELDDYEVADGYPDIRGWEVRAPDGRVLGKVDDLIVSVAEMRVRYLDVDVDRSVASGVADAVTPKGAEAGHALVPVGTAQLDDAGDFVLVSTLASADLGAYPRYSRERGITRGYEESLRARFGDPSGVAAPAIDTAGTAANATSEYYAGAQYDDARLYSGRRRRDRAFSGSPEEREEILRRRGLASDREVSGAADRATSTGPADRLADKVDDLKDRVDGNPASRPGPDATDRPT